MYTCSASSAQHLPDAAIGLASTGAKMVATKALTKAVTGINEARKLKRLLCMGLDEAYKLRNTPAANLALGRCHLLLNLVN